MSPISKNTAKRKEISQLSKNLQYEINRLWIDYYTSSISSEQRIELAEGFIRKYQDKVNLTENRFDHPALMHKERFDVRKQSIAEILADFIIRAETDKTEVVKSRDLELDHDDKYEENTLRIYEDEQGKDSKESGARMPAYSLTWEQVYECMDRPRNPISAQQVKRELAYVKRFPEFYAKTFTQEYGRDYDYTLRRIKRLDLDRVRTCRQCGDGFYAHDLRRKVCDRQRGLLKDGTSSRLSACELNHKRETELWRNR